MEFVAIISLTIVILAVISLIKMRKDAKAQAIKDAEMERERTSFLERVAQQRKAERELMRARMLGTKETYASTGKVPARSIKQTASTYTSSPSTRVVVDDSSDLLTQMIIMDTMNSRSGTVAGTVEWNNDIPTIHRTNTDNPIDFPAPSYSSSYSSDDSSSRSSYSSSSSDSSYSSSSSDSSYSSSSDSGSSFSSD